MSAYTAAVIPVFAGPSLSGETLAAPFERLPPAAAGDMLRLLAGPPCTIVLIDGVFDARPAVWHKEVLVLMARGFRVIGAASMGALRAAELHSFGMIGVGAIFRAYAAGRITADDEVAVVHAPYELGAVPLSLAQVDVRATLAAAVRTRVIDGQAARRLRALSANIFYRDRNWSAVIAVGRFYGLDLDHFTGWLPAGAVNLKTADARQALVRAQCLAPRPPHPATEPPHTCFLDTLAIWAKVRL